MNDKYQGIICGNSDILLKEMLSNNIKVDLILTDPPYNLNKDLIRNIKFLILGKIYFLFEFDLIN